MVDKYKIDNKYKKVIGLIMMIIGLGIYIFSMYSGISGKFSFMHIRLGQQMDVSPIWSISSLFSLMIIGL